LQKESGIALTSGKLGKIIQLQNHFALQLLSCECFLFICRCPRSHHTNVATFANIAVASIDTTAKLEIQMGRKFQMQTMDLALLDLYQRGEISYETAASCAKDPNVLRNKTA
jgi:hypothetical protein